MQLPQPSRGFEWTQAPWGAALRCVPVAAVAPHLFTVGNLQLRDDDGEWEAVAAALGVPRRRLLLIRQVHGSRVAVAQSGGEDPGLRPEADAIVTNDADAAVAVRVADCAPVLLADRRTGAVGAAHAGWRGTIASVASHAIAAMTREFGTRPEDLVAAIGPCLGRCCGEVGEEVVEAFEAAGHRPASLARWFAREPGARPHIDLWTANVDQLTDAGVRPENVHVSGLCTRTHAGLMHSYRAAGPAAGRMVGVIRPRR